MSCSVCASIRQKVLQCPCGLAIYCGVECQKADRKTHKVECKKALAAKALESAAPRCVVCCAKTREVAMCEEHSAHHDCAYKLKSLKMEECPECVPKSSPAGKFSHASLLFIRFLDKNALWDDFNSNKVISPTRKLVDVLNLFTAISDYPPAAYAMANMHHCGYGIPVNFRKAIEGYTAAGNYVPAKHALGVVYSALGQYADSIPFYTEAIELGNMRESYVNRGTMLMTMGDKARSHEDFKKALEMKPDDARTIANLAFWNMSYYKPIAVGQKLAYDLFKKALSLNPTLENASINLAKLCMIKGDAASMDEADQLLRASLHKCSALTCLASLLLHKYTAGHKTDASLLREAKLYITAAVKMNPTVADPYCCLADVQMAENDRETAVATYRKILKKWEHYSSLINLALCLSTEVFDPEVVVLYSRAMLMDPDNMDAYGMLAVYLKSHSKMDEARELLEMALRVEPDHPDILCYYAAVRIQQDPEEKDQWTPYFHRALAVDPTNTLANFQLSKLAMDPDESIRYLVESVKYDTCNYEKWTRLGFLHFLHANGEIGKLNAALGALQSALKLNPDSTVITKLVGDCWYSIGLHYEAAHDAKRAMTAFMQVDESALMFSRAVEKIEAFKKA